MRPAARRTLAATALAALAAGGGLLLPSGGRGADPGAPTTALPVLGVADAQTTIMGAAPGAPGGAEVWAFRRLPLDVPPPVVGGKPLDFAAPGDPKNPDAQLAFMRWTDATGWQVVATPFGTDGVAERGPDPNRLSARITPAGGGVLIGRATGRAELIVRDPGGAWRHVAEPDASTLSAGEALAGSNGGGAVADAAYDDDGGKTGVFVAPQGLTVEDGILRRAGDGTWTREPVTIPAGSSASFRVTALAATDPDHAYALAQTDPTLGDGVVLLRRIPASGGSPVHWEKADLGSSGPWTKATTAASKVTLLAPLGGSAQPLTATTQGVWIDAGFHSAAGGGGDYDATLFYDPGAGGGAGGITASWCDADDGSGSPLCDHPLGFSFSTQQGYRSFAWAGDGMGRRVITNPLAAGGTEATNRGTWMRLDGTSFSRQMGGGGNARPSGGFLSDSDGWLEGPVRVGQVTAPSHLTAYPVALRSPFTAIAAAPAAPAGAALSQALAVGADGAVARWNPLKGTWAPEFLLTSSGAVTHPLMRAVSWPESGRAYAVGDLGAMWLWRADTGLWEKDPGAPLGEEANFQGVAFDPSDPSRGYAVGKGGTLLHYDKTWTQDALPAGFESASFTSIAFAGRQALVAAGADVLTSEGGAWHVDQGLHDLLATLPTSDRSLLTVAGLPDGGAVVAGRDIVIERDSGLGKWRFADQPLTSSTVVAAAPVRDGARVRAIVSVVPSLVYPTADEPIIPDPNVPPPIIPPFGLPGDGYVLRETANGWSDEQQTAFAGSGLDRPVKSDPILAFDLDASGNGWAVGGWSGQADSAGRGTSDRSATGGAIRQRSETAGIYRYSPGAAPAAPPSASVAPVPLPAGVARVAIGGHAVCENPCADLANQGLAPDRTLTQTLIEAGYLGKQANGPAAFLYTGGRLDPSGGLSLSDREAARFSSLLGSSSLPVYSAVSEADSSAGTGAYDGAFANFPAPFGAGGAPSRVTPVQLPGAASRAGGAATHYAFDLVTDGGAVRVVFIDNSAGSLTASDPKQNPAEPQTPWLVNVLADAKTQGIPAIVVGSRDLNTRFHPKLNAASDGDAVARILRDGGASAYFFERPEENRAERIPAGAGTGASIPEFGTGTLGYRSPVTDVGSSDVPDSEFGDAGFLLAEIDASKRNTTTNVAPVTVRLIPTVTDVALDAVDGTLIRRSRVALFQGLGRRPVAGDRWGGATASGTPDPPGGDPYTAFPPQLCAVSGCSTRIAPEYEFASDADDIADFVKTDPNSTNLRKVLLDGNNKTTTDSTSGLLCAFNKGTANVSVRAGGLVTTTQVTVQSGSVQPPCGTRVIKNPTPPPDIQQPPDEPGVPPPVPVTPPGPAPPPPHFMPVVPIIPVVPPKLVIPSPKRAAIKVPHIPVIPPPVLPPIEALPAPKGQPPYKLPGTSPPGNPAATRPIPPGGALARVYQVEEKREEEAAPEQSQAFSRYVPEDHQPLAPYLVGLAVLAAVAGASLRGSLRAGRDRPGPAVVRSTRPTTPRSRRQHR